MNNEKMHSSHWGVFRVSEESQGLKVKAWDDDPDPSPLLGNFTGSADHPTRIVKPAVRRGWL